MPEPFDIQQVDRDGLVVLRVIGHLDARSAPVLLQRCTTVHASGHHLVVNLAGVTFIASSGIGVLLGLAEESRQGSRRVRFACLSPAVGSVIGLLNLDQFLAIDDTEEQAFDALAA